MQGHWIDTSHLITADRNPKIEGIYEIFGRYFSQSPSDVKESLMDWVCDHHNELSSNMNIALRQKNLLFMNWFGKVYDDNYYPDEMSIYCRSHLFNQHTIIFTSGYCWATLDITIMQTEQEISGQCDIKLVYLGTDSPPSPKCLRYTHRNLLDLVHQTAE